MKARLTQHTLSALFVAVLGASFSVGAYAQETDQTESTTSEGTAAVTPPSITKKDASFDQNTLRSRLNASLINEIDQSSLHQRKIDQIVRNTEIMRVEAELAEATLKKEQALQEIKDLATKPKETDQSMPGGPGAPGQFGPFGQNMMSPSQINPQPQITLEAPEAVEVDPIDTIYVTRIYGMGENKAATVYVDNMIFDVQVGDQIIDGIKLLAIDDVSIKIAEGKKTKSLRLTTQEQAYSRSFRALAKAKEVVEPLPMERSAPPMFGY